MLEAIKINKNTDSFRKTSKFNTLQFYSLNRYVLHLLISCLIWYWRQNNFVSFSDAPMAPKAGSTTVTIGGPAPVPLIENSEAHEALDVILSQVKDTKILSWLS